MLGSITNALDFNDVRSQSDAELLYDAKYGKRGEDGRMSRCGGGGDVLRLIGVCDQGLFVGRSVMCTCTHCEWAGCSLKSHAFVCAYPSHREQYRALRRKIGGTYQDYFKVGAVAVDHTVDHIV